MQNFLHRVNFKYAMRASLGVIAIVSLACGQGQQPQVGDSARFRPNQDGSVDVQYLGKQPVAQATPMSATQVAGLLGGQPQPTQAAAQTPVPAKPTVQAAQTTTATVTGTVPSPTAQPASSPTAGSSYQPDPGDVVLSSPNAEQPVVMKKDGRVWTPKCQPPNGCDPYKTDFTWPENAPGGNARTFNGINVFVATDGNLELAADSNGRPG